MGFVTIRLADDVERALQARADGDVSEYVRTVIEDHLAADEDWQVSAELCAALEEGEASGLSERSVEEIIADARARSPPGLTFTRAADRDLLEIWQYTQARWSADQADAYVRAIRASAESLLERPTMGQEFRSGRSTYRRIKVGSHILFYRPIGRELRVIRVLHRRMDVARHLR